ncbi:hypothetical protein ACJRO7_021602 [Eucalyptus globulus]|uniref:Uncharacterized protein n=1 Tax=Eucalyptus globulus TaxID=34317 RepID=A0ABD3KT12_EUCGL
MIATMDSDKEEEIEFEEDEKVRVVKEAGVPVTVDEDNKETTRKKRKTACKARRKRTVKEMGVAAWATRTTARKRRMTRTTVSYRPTQSSSFFRLFLLLRPRLSRPWTGLCFRSGVGCREDEDKDE